MKNLFSSAPYRIFTPMQPPLLPQRWLAPVVYACCLLAALLAPGVWTFYALPLGLLLLAFAAGHFLAKNRRYFSLLDLLFFHALVYLWIAPALVYRYAPVLDPDANFMPIEAGRYFGLAIPGVLALLLGANAALAFWQRPEGDALERVEALLRKQPWLPFLLIALGLAGKALFPMAPWSLRALTYFVFWLSLTGSFYLLFLEKKWKWVALAALYLLLLRWSLDSTQAGPPLWALVFAALLLFFRYRVKPWVQLLCYGGAFVLVLLALQVKFDFRTAMRREGMPKDFPSQLAIFSQALFQGDTTFFSPQRWTRSLDRLNQGYHVAMAMRHTPSIEPYAHGETIGQALLGALVPRILWRDKPQAGGHDMYIRFAGQRLSYSANLGPLGEAYVNFGVRGAVVAMLLFGFLLGGWYAGLSRLTRRWPALLLWLPFIFSAMLSLETDFATVLNHGVKGMVFTGMVFWGVKVGGKWINSSDVSK
ncbi:MAG: O-antigen polysaccharide polymerase Wzy [Lewinellaceae bacterium]|nr:O-antigen polysaccharide polymerase Wzy [Lewinellaceae bacterium]